MRIAITQPYLFPYLGYFQLIGQCDKFVFYDDVHFINKGWINRNRILLNGQPHMFSVPLVKASQNKLIKDIELSDFPSWSKSFEKTLVHAYSRAPYFTEVMSLIRKILAFEVTNIGDLAIDSVVEVCEYLGLKVKFARSSIDHSGTKNLDRADRLIEIAKAEECSQYVNLEGGRELYEKEYFRERGVELTFSRAHLSPYNQHGASEFVVGLSIIDVLMNLGKEETARRLDMGQLV